ncbi:3-oxoacyl-[acyl-carrier-protein] synthase-3 [Lachnospiraceae bacterium XPB1003]|nr:3-oxoacyl-[acyl-carrier-protein] synthase-3 [Lachnospiraceae bacterium XPB1003]
MNGLKIVGMGRGIPAKRVTNDDLSKIVETDDEWIRKRTGIRSRHFCGEGESNTTMACEAALEAVKNAGISLSQIGICVAATLTTDYVFPGCACRIQEAIGLSDGIPCFDINAACSGFIYGLYILSGVRSDPEKPYALLVGVEQLSRIMDMNDRSTCVLFGDGAAAAVIKMDEGGDFYSHVAARGNTPILHCEGMHQEGGYIYMAGRDVFTFAVEVVEKEVARLEETTDYTLDDMDYVVLHQANERIIRHIQKKKNIPDEKLPINIYELGNTSAASIPLVLYELWTAGKLTPGKKVFVSGFGGGLTWGSAVIEF